MVINGHNFYDMMISAANALDNNKTAINNMNVFPVPDGDTGINMTLTLSTVKNLQGFDGPISECSSKISDMVLRSARGNSGAILSLFFRGMAKALAGLENADATDIAKAFRRGTDEAYKAVMNPTEGTILTVMRKTAEEAEEIAKTRFAGDVEGMFVYLMDIAQEALDKTPEQLPILKEVNVVDAGGYGFVTALGGMTAALEGKPVELIEGSSDVSETVFDEFDTESITFSYCTECVVEKNDEFKGEGTARELHELICSIGDSVVFIDDEEIIKLHVHTDHPGQVFEKALEYGALATAKIENMKKQHSSLVSTDEKKESDPVPAHSSEYVSKVMKPTKKYGFVSVCMGEGITAAFKDLGADYVIHGGQTMNPSTQDIIDGINATPAEIVYVLPNNKNIYLVAVQAAKLVSGKKVVVMNTRSVPQGISAMIAFNPDGEAEDNKEAMEASIANVTSMSVTHAIRNTTIEGAKIVSGQMLGMVNGHIECVGDNSIECLDKLADEMKDASYIMLFYGDDVPESEAQKAEATIRAKTPNADIALIAGGQPIYDYIISVE